MAPSEGATSARHDCQSGQKAGIVSGRRQYGAGEVSKQAPSCFRKYQLGDETDPGMIAATVPLASDVSAGASCLAANELLVADPTGNGQAVKAKTDAGSSATSQIILNKFLPHYDVIAERRRDQVERRAASARSLIDRELPDWIAKGAGRGPSMWIYLPTTDRAEFAAFSYQAGIAVGYGGM